MSPEPATQSRIRRPGSPSSGPLPGRALVRVHGSTWSDHRRRRGMFVLPQVMHTFWPELMLVSGWGRGHPSTGWALVRQQPADHKCSAHHIANTLQRAFVRSSRFGFVQLTAHRTFGVSVPWGLPSSRPPQATTSPRPTQGACHPLHISLWAVLAWPFWGHCRALDPMGLVRALTA